MTAQRNPVLNRRTMVKTASLAALAGVGASRSSPVLAAKNGVLKLRLQADIQNLDPAFEPQDHDLQVMYNLYENLVGFAPGTFDLVNTLAETWVAHPDGLGFEFTLKRGIQFHRGFGEVTAEDVKFSFERIAGLTLPVVNSPYRRLWSALKEVRVTGSHSGIIVLSNQSAPLMTLSVPGNVGQVVSRKAVEQFGDKFGTNPVGTGPYEFVEWVPRERIVLRRFKDYSGANSAYAKIAEWVEVQFYPITDDSNAEIALETREIDFGAVPLTAVARFEKNRNFAVSSKTGFGYKFIGMNVQDSVLKDIDVRRAIRAAIDVPSIVDAAFEGRWTRATAVLPPSIPIGYWKDAPPGTRDLALARQLLAKASVKAPHLSFSYNKSEPGAATVAEIVQANLAEIGIEVDVVPQENAVAMQTSHEANAKRQMFYIGFGSQGDPAQSVTWFTCDQIDKWNFMNWCDQGFTDLAAKGTIEQDPRRRAEIYIEMQRQWDRVADTVWIAWPTSFYAAPKDIVPSLRPDGRMLAWNFRGA